jgi:integrase
MPHRQSARIPKYRKHKQSGKAIVTLPLGGGQRRDVLLGDYGSPASLAEYQRVIAEWQSGSRLPAAGQATHLSVSELLTAFLEHAEKHYRKPDGTPTNEIVEYEYTLRPLVELYGLTPAAGFGPLALKTVRQRMIEANWCRTVINHRVNRIRHVFKWAVENELVPPSVYHGLQAVAGLQRGRSKARESKPVKPVPEAVVKETLPFLSRQVAAMVQLQLLTGMRPGEVTVMRGIDLDTSKSVWLYTPGSDQGELGDHKTAHHGYKRVVALGPKAQLVLRPWLRTNLTEYLFSPREAEEARHAERRQNRQTPMTPSQARRQRKKRPKKQPAERYEVSAYAHAIRTGIQAANKARACEACKRLKPAARCVSCQSRALPHWHPHQLRHTRATEIRRTAGLEAARAVLGHRSPVITEHYAELDIGQAVEVMAKIG